VDSGTYGQGDGQVCLGTLQLPQKSLIIQLEPAA
jgi:hypothetical protein